MMVTRAATHAALASVTRNVSFVRCRITCLPGVPWNPELTLSMTNPQRPEGVRKSFIAIVFRTSGRPAVEHNMHLAPVGHRRSRAMRYLRRNAQPGTAALERCRFALSTGLESRSWGNYPSGKNSSTKVSAACAFESSPRSSPSTIRAYRRPMIAEQRHRLLLAIPSVRGAARTVQAGQKEHQSVCRCKGKRAAGIRVTARRQRPSQWPLECWLRTS